MFACQGPVWVLTEGMDKRERRYWAGFLIPPQVVFFVLFAVIVGLVWLLAQVI